MATLTATQRKTIKNSPKTAKELSAKYDVSTSTIYKIKSGETTATKPAAKSTARTPRAKSRSVGA